MPDKQVTVRLPAEIAEAAERAAKADDRPLAALMRKLLADYLKANGYL